MKMEVFLYALGALSSVVHLAAQSPTPLSALLSEAAKSNPEILAAQHMWRASTYVKQQVTTLPNPQITFQDFSVGSPRPLAGFTNSNFAYIGLGASQELPYPGKLRLKGEVAERAAAVQEAQIAVTRATVADQIKAAYLKLAYLQQTLTLLEDSQITLAHVTESELLRYRTGAGNQADILKAELQKTKLLREITMNHQEMGIAEAALKQLTHRPQASPDIIADNLTETTLHYASNELFDFVKPQSPEVNLSGKTVERYDTGLKSAKRSGKPDFSVGYMYQRTGPDFPAYYMLTVNLIPQRRQRVHAEVEEAAEMLEAAEQDLDTQIQQQMAEVQKQYVAAVSTVDQLTEFRDGIIPQADEAFHSVLVGYESNKQQLDTVLTSLNDVYELKRECAQVLLDHETALARLETLTGVTLR